jgi:hypothetical protein
MKVGDE